MCVEKRVVYANRRETIRKKRSNASKSYIDHDCLKKSARGTTKTKPHESGFFAKHDNTVVIVASICVSVDPVQNRKTQDKKKKEIDVPCPFTSSTSYVMTMLLWEVLTEWTLVFLNGA